MRRIIPRQLPQPQVGAVEPPPPQQQAPQQASQGGVIGAAIVGVGILAGMWWVFRPGASITVFKPKLPEVQPEQAPPPPALPT